MRTIIALALSTLLPIVCFARPNGSSSSSLGCDRETTCEAVVDLCGVCGGDNSTCKDCAGVPNGGACTDLCGVCGGDDSTCKDCKGVPNGNAKFDACGVCDGDGKSCLGCDSVPQSGKVLDACGVCGGDSTTCQDCNHVPKGGAVIDSCGVCNGNNSTCKDCKGIPNGTAVVDACGVCGGGVTEAAKCLSDECSGHGKIDKCGVCGGNDACLDCAGNPNGSAKVDCCGVCNGDGSTCLDKCKFYDLAESKRDARRSLNQLLSSVKKYSNGELSCTHGKSKKAIDRIALAKKLVQENVSLLESFIKTKIKICDTVFCSKTSLLSVTGTLATNAKTLFNLSRQSQYAAGKACKAPIRRIRSRGGSARGNYGTVTSAIKQVPPQVCNN